MEKAREFDPFRHAGLTPSGKIKMTPVDDTAGEFFVVLRIIVLARRGSMSNTTKYDCKIKNILRCYAVGMGIKETANTFHISRNTVRKYVRLFISSGKPTDQLLELAEEQLRDMFGCTEFRHREPSQRQPFSTSGCCGGHRSRQSQGGGEDQRP